jgi:micrococcal nuclease
LIKHRNYIIGFGFFLLVLFSLCFVHVGTRHSAEKHEKEKTTIIRIDKRYIRPDDGDTFFYRDLTIRILGIDTPEIIHKDHGIFEDQPYGRQAAEMTISLLRKAKMVEYLPFQNDKYGRLLAHVFIDGELLSIHLIRARLAYENISYYGDNGFPDLAKRILKAAENSPRPPFEKPYIWRREHQLKK